MSLSFVINVIKTDSTMRTVFTIAILLIAFTVKGQDKLSSLGIRFGGVSGVSFKYIDNDYSGFEIIAGATDGGFQLTGLIQKYKAIATDKVGGLFLFTGAGAHAGYNKTTYTTTLVKEGKKYYSTHELARPIIGGDFMVGAEYHFESIPLHLSLDYKPYFELFGKKTFRLDLWDIGFTIKYAFNG